MLAGTLSFYGIFQNLSGAPSSWCGCDFASFCNNHAVLITFAYRDKNFALIAYSTIINSAKNASGSSVLGYKGVVGLQNKH